MTIIITLLLCTALSLQCAAPEVMAKHEGVGQASDHDDNHENNTYPGLNAFLRRNGKRVTHQLHVPGGENSYTREHKLHDDRYLLVSSETKRDERGKKIDKSSKLPMILYDTYTNKAVSRWRMRRHNPWTISGQDNLILFMIPYLTSYQLHACSIDNTEEPIKKLGSWKIRNSKETFCSDGSRFLTYKSETPGFPEPNYHNHTVTVWDAQTLKKVAALQCTKKYFKQSGHLDDTHIDRLLSAHGTRMLTHAHKREQADRYDKRDPFFVFEQFNVDTGQKEFALSIPNGIGYGWDMQTGQDLYVVVTPEMFTQDVVLGELQHYQNGALVNTLQLTDDAFTKSIISLMADFKASEACKLRHSQRAYLIPASEKKVFICLANEPAGIISSSECTAAFLYDGNTQKMHNLSIRPPIVSYDNAPDYVADPTHCHFAFKISSKEIALVDTQDGKVNPLAFRYPINSIENIAGTHYTRVTCKEEKDKEITCIIPDHLIKPIKGQRNACYYDEKQRYIELTGIWYVQHYYYIDMQTGQRIKKEDVPTLGVTGNVLEYTESNCYRIQPHVNPKHMSKEQIDLMYRAMQHKKATKQALDVAGNQQDATIFDTLPVFLKACDNIIRNNAS